MPAAVKSKSSEAGKNVIFAKRGLELREGHLLFDAKQARVGEVLWSPQATVSLIVKSNRSFEIWLFQAMFP